MATSLRIKLGGGLGSGVGATGMTALARSHIGILRYRNRNSWIPFSFSRTLFRISISVTIVD